jgi:hypothetical protein
MSSRSSGPASRPVAVALCLMLAAFAVAIFAAATAHAYSHYKLVMCAAANGANGPAIATNYPGEFSFEDHCGASPDPAGNNAFMRIAETKATGYAAVNAYGSMSWTMPPDVVILAGGGYTREPNAFNDGWRGRYWAEGFGGDTNNILMQGAGVANGSLGGIGWAPTSTFASHLWPFSGYGFYRRFVFELTCFRPAGCDRSNYNAVDGNTMVLILEDVQPVQLWLTNTGAPPLSGQWVRGNQTVSYAWNEQGSGIRMEWIDIDGARRHTIDHYAECNAGYSPANGEFARAFQPCATAQGIGRAYGFDTASLPDGAHTVQACGQDYAQWKGLDGTGSASCDSRTIRTDNHAPGKPAALAIRSANPNRYESRFGAAFSLSPDPGSPIRKVHYEILNAANQVVVAEKTVSGTNPSELKEIEGPAKAGAYRLKLWLEDEVGFQGPAAEVAIPHDTTPPAAPQDLRVAGPTTARWVPKLDLSWHDITDSGSPIDAAHYQLVDGSGHPVGPARTVAGDDVQAIHGIETPAQRGDYRVRVWLSDEEGNVGAAASAPLPIDTTPPAAPQGLSVTPPGTDRVSDGFDLRWHDITDSGSPIDAVHYQVLDASGRVAVPTQTVKGEGVEAIEDLEAPSRSGNYTLRLWLEDEEGNAGAPVTAPLAYECAGSDAAGGRALSAGLGASGAGEAAVRQGQGSDLRGRLAGGGSGVAGAALCVFSRVVTDRGSEFLGLAVSGPGGAYRFPVPAGASRELSVLYRSGHREVAARAVLQTVVRPSLKARSKVVANKHYARFFGRIPGPDNDGVVVVLQVKQHDGWRAFRRYRTREGGRYRLLYRFGRTTSPATYLIRAQVRRQGGYPYLPGNSKLLRLAVIR